MQVTDIKVRFMRKIQIREYEPAEAEVALTAFLEEGEEDHAAAIQELMSTAKDGVREGLLTTAAGKTAAKTTKAPAKADTKTEAPAKETEAAKEEKPKRARRTKAQMEADKKTAAEKAAAKKAAAESDVPSDDDIPGDDDAKGNISNDPENRVDPNDIPGDEDDDAALLAELTGEGPSHEDLNELIGNAVGGTGKKKVAGGTIKEILGAYKAARVRDVATGDIQVVMDEIQAKIDG